jgi:hypothetical protein
MHCGNFQEPDILPPSSLIILTGSACYHKGAGPCAVAALLLLGDIEEARTRAEALLTGQQVPSHLTVHLYNPMSDPVMHWGIFQNEVLFSSLKHFFFKVLSAG